MTTEEEPDEGLAPERTALAWWRTALAAVVAGALVVRQAVGTAEQWVTAAVTFAAVGVLLVVVTARTRALTRRGPDDVMLSAVVTLPVTLALFTLQVLALILIL